MIGIAIDINPLINPYIIGYGNGQNSENWFTNHKPEGGANFTWSLDTKNYDDKYLVKRDTKNNAPSTWSENEKKAAVFADSEVLRIFEKYGWKWNCGGWYPKATYPQNVDNDTQHFDFIGMPEEIKQKGSQWNYTDSSNLQLVNGSSGSSGNANGSGTGIASNTTYYIKYASWSQTVIKEEYDQKDPLKNRKDNTKVINNMTSRTFNYQGLLNGYTLPFNYLWAWLVVTEDKEFVMDLADLAYNSDIEITIHDNYSESDNIDYTTYIETTSRLGPDQFTPTKIECTKKTTTTVKNTSQMNDLTKANVWVVDYTHNYKLENNKWEDDGKNIIPKDKADSEEENFVTLLKKHPQAKNRYNEWKGIFYEIVELEENRISDMEDITKYLVAVEDNPDSHSDNEVEIDFNKIYDPENFKMMSWNYFNTEGDTGSIVGNLAGGGNQAILQAASKIHDYMVEHKYEYCSSFRTNLCSHNGQCIQYAEFSDSINNLHYVNCVSYVAWVLKEANYNVNGTAVWPEHLEKLGFIKITNDADLQPGDIIWCKGGGHVEIYAGDNKVFSAGDPPKNQQLGPRQKVHVINPSAWRAPN